MATRITTFSVEKESGLGARHLLKLVPGNIPADSPVAPALLYLEKILAPSGARTHRTNLERASRILGGHGLDYAWADLRSGHLEFVRARMRAEDYAPSTINSTLAALRGVARWAWHLGQMKHEDYDRLHDVSLVGAEADRRRPARALAPSEITQLFLSCEVENSLCAVRDAGMLALLYAGGLRRTEACEVLLSAYTPRTHTLMVCGKGKRRRRVYFDDGGARRAINAWLRVRGEWDGTLLAPVNRHGEVLRRALSVSGLYEALKRRALAAGVEPFTPHDLRRSAAKHLRQDGVDLDLVRAILGHRKLSTTQVYLMVDESEKRAAAMKIKVSFRTGGRRGRRRKRRYRKS